MSEAMEGENAGEDQDVAESKKELWSMRYQWPGQINPVFKK